MTPNRTLLAVLIAMVVLLGGAGGPRRTFAGSLAQAPATPAAPAPAPPSNPGGPGPAVDLTGDPDKGADIYRTNCQVCHGDQGRGGVSNPGSTDQTVPALRPIDSTIASADRKQFAINLDLFIRHGSMPEGTRPAIQMPAWGDLKRLTPQQIADVIAYVIRLNGP